MAAGTKKQRLDILIVERRLAKNLDAARRLIGAGSVQVKNQVCDKAGTLIDSSSLIAVKPAKRFVSRGGGKLAAGLLGTGITPYGYTCADIGCSTGGFTDCLLQHGAKKVYCVDVGYGLLDWKLRQDRRVVVLERTNARHLTRQKISEPLDLVVIDASFISLEPLLAPLLPLFRDAVRILALVKPQFQLPREMVGPGGIVEDTALHQESLAMVRQFGQDLGLCCAGIVTSPVRGTKGNQEFFMLLTNASDGRNEETKNLAQGDRDAVSTTD